MQVRRGKGAAMGNMKQRTWVATVAAVCLVWFLMPGMSYAGPHEWTWMSGANTTNQVGVYGTKGVADADNVPGARLNSRSWTDSSGNLWLFGGDGYDSVGSIGLLNDLWRYDMATNEWTWMSGSSTRYQGGVYGTQGTPGDVNVPGARAGSVSWIDSFDRMWVFGGWGFDQNAQGRLNDLWVYDPDTNMWTWMSGPSTRDQLGYYGSRGTSDPDNVPGARFSSVAWMDSSGTMWLFGGEGYDSAGNLGFLNDLWRYNPATNEWTWVSGSNFRAQAGIYGTKGIPSSSNMPSARYRGLSWTDSAGRLWMFGGRGYTTSSSSSGYLNDLWVYDPVTGMWTWMSGANTLNRSGVYGTQGIPGAANVPGARYWSISWTDTSGNLWLIGGEGYDRIGNKGYLNDLWVYEPATGLWTWMSGANTRNQTGIYGTLDTPAAVNIPGARLKIISWTDTSGNLLLFGGEGYDSAGNIGYLNDLWRYELECEVDSDCPVDYQCVEGSCEDLDAPPVIGDGPYVAADTWPVFATSPDAPTYLKQNEYALWTFSDDYIVCSEQCTHSATVQSIADESTWTTLSVTTDPTGERYAYAELPVDQLQNATTYALRFTVTDCAGQSTQSPTYYFRVAREDAPPVIGDGPFLADGWKEMPTSQSKASVLNQNEYVLWTFSDDYASCGGLCTHRARYKNIDSGDWVWTWISVSTDPSGEWYAYTVLPVGSLAAGTYMFRFALTDCAGQLTKSKIYYFKVEQLQ